MLRGSLRLPAEALHDWDADRILSVLPLLTREQLRDLVEPVSGSWV